MLSHSSRILNQWDKCAFSTAIQCSAPLTASCIHSAKASVRGMLSMLLDAIMSRAGLVFEDRGCMAQSNQNSLAMVSCCLCIYDQSYNLILHMAFHSLEQCLFCRQSNPSIIRVMQILSISFNGLTRPNCRHCGGKESCHVDNKQDPSCLRWFWSASARPLQLVPEII